MATVRKKVFLWLPQMINGERHWLKYAYKVISGRPVSIGGKLVWVKEVKYEF